MQASKIGLWFYSQMQTKNWFTSKTFWNSAAQKLAIIAVAVVGVDPDTANQISAIVLAVSAFGVDMWVRKHTKTNVGDPMPARHNDTEAEEHGDVFLDSDD